MQVPIPVGARSDSGAIYAPSDSGENIIVFKIQSFWRKTKLLLHLDIISKSPTERDKKEIKKCRIWHERSRYFHQSYEIFTKRLAKHPTRPFD